MDHKDKTFNIYFLTSGDSARERPEVSQGRERIRSETLFQKRLTQAAAANGLAGSLDIILVKISSDTL